LLTPSAACLALLASPKLASVFYSAQEMIKMIMIKRVLQLAIGHEKQAAKKKWK